MKSIFRKTRVQRVNLRDAIIGYLIVALALTLISTAI
jgi:hypothetical protein